MKTVLIVASSGRMLAQAAKNIGFTPLVIDLFADLDTQAYAQDFRQVKSLAQSDLTAAIDYFIERYAVEQVIYGSGFENYPESLYYLASRLTVLGNHPDVFAKQLDKSGFFATLASLHISYPEVAFSPPAQGTWLIKPRQGQGGIGIEYYRTGDKAKASVYWQRFQQGQPHSVLFVADGQNVQVVGFNRQWSVGLSTTQAFIFSGVINSCELSDVDKAEIIGWLAQLVPVFRLKGLNSLDFIHFEGCSYVLEINPRPSASMQLYAPDLLAKHVQTCLGALVADGRLTLPPQVGYQVVYADAKVTIPDQFAWPTWCMDLPRSGNICHTGQPICSIIAHQKQSASVAEQLLMQQQFLFNKLKGFDQYGI
jgi:methenyltetrahydromethanopterin cyclohydrolase